MSSSTSSWIHGRTKTSWVELGFEHELDYPEFTEAAAELILTMSRGGDVREPLRFAIWLPSEPPQL